ncbi:hypothetical protein H7097_02110 [Aeromicrobium sp.]|nr:hypothetical protein [Candidatus Saccharibacteria bacterium]
MSATDAHRLVSLQSISALIVALLLVAGLLHSRTAYGAQLPTRSIELSSASASATDSYQLTFTLPQAETLGSIKLQFCAESPLVGNPCTLPVGMNLNSTSLASQTGGAGFSIVSASGTDIILGRAPVATGATSLTFKLSGIVNPSTNGSYFGRIQTYTTAAGTGASTDYGGLAFTINTSVNISATVPPYLYFCVGITVTGVNCATAVGDYINFGNFSPAIASVAQTQMVAGSNADTGYFISVNGSTLTSGNNVIPELAAPDVSRPGVSQFGINLVANSDPQVGQAPAGAGTGSAVGGYKIANQYKYTDGDTVATATQPDEARRYTTSYLANVKKDQAPGVYVTTLTYVATAGF